MNRVALLDASGVVINVIAEPDPDSGWTPPAGVTVWDQEPIPARGWRLEGGVFLPPEVEAATDKVLMPVAFWFLRLTAAETVFFNRLRKQAQALTDEDYDDPTKAGIVAWEAFLTNFDLLTNDIDLAHPLVIQGVGHFLAMFAAATGATPADAEARTAELLEAPSA